MRLGIRDRIVDCVMKDIGVIFAIVIGVYFGKEHPTVPMWVVSLDMVVGWLFGWLIWDIGRGVMERIHIKKELEKVNCKGILLEERKDNDDGPSIGFSAGGGDY